MKKIILFSFTTLFLTMATSAKTENVVSSNAEVASVETQQPQPAEITSKQKLELRKRVMKTLRDTTLHSTNAEKQLLAETLNNLQETKVRQENMLLPSHEQVKYQKSKPNTKNNLEFHNYLRSMALEYMNAPFDETEKDKQTNNTETENEQ